jgi:hypothetical protein
MRGGEINPDWQDEILTGAALTRGVAMGKAQLKVAEHVRSDRGTTLDIRS